MYYGFGDAGVTYAWDFGDSSPLYYGQIAINSYVHPGNYKVSLEMTNACGNDTILNSAVSISKNLDPANAYAEIEIRMSAGYSSLHIRL